MAACDVARASGIITSQCITYIYLPIYTNTHLHSPKGVPLANALRGRGVMFGQIARAYREDPFP